VVEHLTRNPKIKGSNPAAGPGIKKIIRTLHDLVASKLNFDHQNGLATNLTF